MISEINELVVKEYESGVFPTHVFLGAKERDRLYEQGMTFYGLMINGYHTIEFYSIVGKIMIVIVPEDSIMLVGDSNSYFNLVLSKRIAEVDSILLGD